MHRRREVPKKGKSLVHLTRRYMSSASPRVHTPRLADGENSQIYGKCNNPGGHGHNYFLEVTVAGPIDPLTGMVVNLAELDGYVQNAILTPFDQTSLNGQPIFAKLVPTSENLCLEIHRILRERWEELPSGKKARLQCVRLEETSSNFFEYNGDA